MLPGDNADRASQGASVNRVQLVIESLRAPERTTDLCRDAGISEADLSEWRGIFLNGGTNALAVHEQGRGGALDDDLYRKIVESFPANLLVSRPDDGAILFRSASTEATYGQRVHTREHWADDEQRKVFIGRLKTTGHVDRMRFKGRKSDGTEFPAQLSARLIEHEGRSISVTTSTDLTEILSISAENEQANLRFNEALEAMEEGFVLWDSGLRVVLTNDRVVEMFGVQDNPPQPGESMFEAKDRFAAILAPPPGMTMDQAMAAGAESVRSYKKNFKLRMRDGRTLLCSAHKTGLDGYLCTFRDVTEQLRLQAELDHQREITHQNEKLSALGELLAGVAHELNNPLSVVVGYALMLQEQLRDPVKKKRIDRIALAAERCARIVKTFLAMARQRPVHPEPLSLNDVIAAAMETADSTVRSKGTQIVFDLDEDLPLVDADADQLIQVFANLISNARHALSGKGEDGILTLKTYFDDKYKRVAAEVVDNGPGIPKNLHARIFEPFFTTKAEGEGTGIGLAFCYRIVDTYGGRLSLKSRLGKGARFVVRLPPSQRQPAPPPDHAPEKELARRVYKVLVIDDESGVRDMLVDLLMQTGFEVEAMADAPSALKILESKSFDIILSDVRMPGMDGEAFYHALRESFPEYIDRLAFVTGDVMSAGIAGFLEDASIPHLEKPVVPSELNELIETLCAKMERARP